MALRFFNTLTRKKENFIPITKGKVGMYTCGPTVYNFPHIGNYRAYLFEDQIRRYLEYLGYEVKQVMNLTDIDDKTIRESKKEGISLADFTSRYKKAFFEDLKTLNIEPAEVYPAATDHINEMIALIEILLKKGFAYIGDDKSVYYDISKFDGYGKLAHMKIDELKEGARVKQDEYEKNQAQDFALWKAWDENDGDVWWDSPFGKGRPGWHIECSAMSMKYLGETFDIHTGGVDNMFPHHENEIAQSEAATGKPFVHYWMHCEHLLVDGKKMSKSTGNFYTLRDLIDKGFKPKAIRYLLCSTNYKQQLNFTFEAVSAAENTVEKMLDFMRRLRHVQIKVLDKEIEKKVDSLIEKAKNEFELAMDDNLNISSALSSLFDLIKEANILLAKDCISCNEASRIIDAMMGFDKVLGILKEEEKDLNTEIIALIEKREQARKSKDYAESDRIRDYLKTQGIILDDTKAGVRYKRA